MTEPGEKNSILNTVEIKGTIRFSKELAFDGTLDGDITSHEGVLVIGTNAKIRGNLRAHSVVVKGKVNGNITAENRCEIQGGAELAGDLKTARLVLDAGAMFVGRSEVNPSNVAIGVPSGAKQPLSALAGEKPKMAVAPGQETFPEVKG
jgi:cytoskeletal protein CcmA (bactofilin family)